MQIFWYCLRSKRKDILRWAFLSIKRYSPYILRFGEAERRIQFTIHNYSQAHQLVTIYNSANALAMQIICKLINSSQLAAHYRVSGADGERGVKMNDCFSASRCLVIQRKKRHVSALIFWWKTLKTVGLARLLSFRPTVQAHRLGDEARITTGLGLIHDAIR